MKLRPRALEALDSLAHFLYRPTMLGRGLAVARWHHRIHLIPHRLMDLICGPYERSIWAGFEDDEPLEDVVAAFERGQKGITAPPVTGWKCPHLTITASAPGILLGPPVKSWCDCVMEPIGRTA